MSKLTRLGDSKGITDAEGQERSILEKTKQGKNRQGMPFFLSGKGVTWKVAKSWWLFEKEITFGSKKPSLQSSLRSIICQR